MLPNTFGLRHEGKSQVGIGPIVIRYALSPQGESFGQIVPNDFVIPGLLAQKSFRLVA